jgi:hypothetical protein
LRRKCDTPSYVLINLAITLIGDPYAVSYELEIAGRMAAARRGDAPHLARRGKCLVNAPAKWWSSRAYLMKRRC